MKLTARTVAGLRLADGQTDKIFFDDDVPGFGLRVRDNGSRNWVYQYRIGTKTRRIMLGTAGSMDAVLARKTASNLFHKVKLGGDPAREKDTARQEADNTFGVLAEQYYEARKLDWAPRNAVDVRRHLFNYAAPIHRLPIASLSHKEVADLLASVAKKSGDVTSNRLRATLTAFLSWAIRQGVKLPEGNVASHTEKRKERSRERVLTNAELKAIWNADRFGGALRLLILTGQRLNEIGKLRWDEIRGDYIVLPAERTKNRRSHTVPLSEPAKAIIAGIPVDGRTHLFGRDDLGCRTWAENKPKLDAALNLPQWTYHDIRRTVATRMAELGVQPHIIEAVLNHVSGHKAGVAGIYNRATYDKEKREALNIWAEHVTALVEGRPANVLPLKRA
jgi:integrase